MRFIRTGGLLAAVAALFVLVAMTSGASGATLCEVTTEPCPEAKAYGPKKTLEAQEVATKAAEITTDIGTLKCPTSKWVGEAEATALGEFSSGEITSFTFNTATCTFGAAACTAVTGVNTSYKMGVTGTGSGNGTITFAQKSNPPGIFVQCTGIECTFKAKEVPLTLTGGATAIAKASRTMEWSGNVCPHFSATFSAEYEVTTPAPLFITKEVAPPKLCKSNTTPCPAAEVYGLPVTVKASLEAESKFKYTYNGASKEPACKVSTPEGKVTATGSVMTGQISSLTFGECGGGVCTITSLHTPYALEIDRTGGGNGTMGWTSSGAGQPGVQITCNSIETCKYQVSEITFSLTGGTPAKLVSSKVSLTRESSLETLCSATASWEGVGGVEEVKYKITGPSPLFIRS